MLEQEKLTEAILGAVIEVHKILGPGLLESAYEQCLCREFLLRNLKFRRQVDCSIEYKGEKLDCGYRIDILVEETVILELKAIDKLTSVHEAQLLSYMKLAAKPIGFLINFNTRLVKDGIIRRAL